MIKWKSTYGPWPLFILRSAHDSFLETAQMPQHDIKRPVIVPNIKGGDSLISARTSGLGHDKFN